MQGDLISRTRLRTEVDWLLERKMISPNTMAMLHRLIDGQPTAYSVEVVVSKLEKEKGTVFIDGKPMYNEDDFIDIDKAIEIVRNGGKE